MRAKRLGQFERSVLLAIIHLEGNGYGVSIADEIARRTGERVSYGAVYATLDRLQRKGLIGSELGGATPERGGKPKRFYRIEARGRLALRDAEAAASQMREGLPSIGVTA